MLCGTNMLFFFKKKVEMSDEFEMLVEVFQWDTRALNFFLKKLVMPSPWSCFPLFVALLQSITSPWSTQKIEKKDRQ